MDYSIRPGSANDKSVFNKSTFGATSHLRIPRGSIFLADAGYQIMSHILTPYPITNSMTPEESKYNLLHSRTRMVVEGAFGLLKNVFRIFKRELNHESAQSMADIIKVSLVLHNWMIDLRDRDETEEVEQSVRRDQQASVPIHADDIHAEIQIRADAKQRRETLKEYLWRLD